MPITINGNGHISGLVVGGLPNGTVDADTLASNSVTTAKIHNAAVTSAKTSGIGGLTMADHWRITNNGTLNTDTTSQLNDSIAVAWERADTNSPGFIGTGMSEDNGVFTFPSTGIYQIIGNLQVARDSERIDMQLYIARPPQIIVLILMLLEDQGDLEKIINEIHVVFAIFLM